MSPIQPVQSVTPQSACTPAKREGEGRSGKWGQTRFDEEAGPAGAGLFFDARLSARETQVGCRESLHIFAMISAVARFLGQRLSKNFTPFAKGDSLLRPDSYEKSGIRAQMRYSGANGTKILTKDCFPINLYRRKDEAGDYHRPAY